MLHELKNQTEQINTLTKENKDLESQVNTLTSQKKTLDEKVSSTQTTKSQTSKTTTQTTQSTSASAETPAQTTSYTVYVTNTGKKYHSAGCSYLRQSQIAKDKNTAISEGYTACSRCNP